MIKIMARIFSFPNPVNEKAARSAAAGVVLMSLAFIATGARFILIPLAVGFVLRVAAGPRFSPLGRLAVHVIAPRFGDQKLVPGPPKRFAQAIGATLSVSAALSTFAFHTHTPATVLVVMIAAAAFLEAAVGFCLGCVIFAQLMKFGIIPEDVCESCNNITPRLLAASVAASRNVTVGASS
jgi:Domain of unknown function (DUF4395)